MPPLIEFFVTHDAWHLTQDRWHMVRVNILSKFQLPSSYGLGWTVSWRFWTKGWLNDWMNQWMNDKGIYRTAPATPGMLMTHPSLLSLKAIVAGLQISQFQPVQQENMDRPFIRVVSCSFFGCNAGLTECYSGLWRCTCHQTRPDHT